ncbi:coenzyme PQQ synthesis protein E [Agaricicola taiwanensis]|uniref:PqqA peptide cyclase n=1 Tax=Agaricicola taiwanensis TaxID=591372 RepID=A0A8J3DY25_9RHOB|nr:pyrroloquinoline quinone biosynthesis protein PqqE [Agaricicola taiwanensis]GGE49065.1 coenzyme PQQ synthesis protein E [Agaricicola taiwanensis]
MNAALPYPTGLLAELTHRCPLGCPYCSNPLELASRDQELDTPTWQRIFSEAAALGVLQVHLSGGEPLARRDLTELVAHCAAERLYTNLITSGVGLTEARLEALKKAGLDHVQLSVQDANAESADHIAGYRGAFERKRQVAQWVVASGLPLTINAVIHRANVTRAAAMVDLAVQMGAGRVEIAHAQYYGWALRNRDMLLPSGEDARAAVAEIETLKPRYADVITIDHVIPDYYARFPKVCMGGWGRRTLNVVPTGKVLPCHAAETIPGLEFWSAADRSLADIWANAPAFQAFRGTDWMQEPCRSCDRRDKDFGGCRCQAMALAGDARATDPACSRSPHHALMAEIRFATPTEAPGVYRYRR